MTITEFILARVAEDESDADRWHNTSDDDLRSIEFFGPREGENCRCGGPARVLAECKAKRAIVASWLEVVIDDDGTDDSAETLRHPTDEAHTGWTLALWHTLRALAAVYATHSDYDESWTL